MLTFSPSDIPASFGHHFIVGLSGPKLDRTDKELLKKLRPIGVLLLQRNFLATMTGQPIPYTEWMTGLRELLSETKKYAEREDLIVSIDHEGGRVNRAPPPISNFPYAAQYYDHVDEVSAMMASELISMGINVCWAPVADVHSNPANPVIGPRAFHTTPEGAGMAAVTVVKNFLAKGVLPCAKHFPGHGDTGKDSHYELPVLTRSHEQLGERELLPFEMLIKAGVPLVMTAHILFPAIDKLNPATFSPLVLKELLRDQLSFSGVVVSDDLDMLAVAKRLKSENGCSEIINASCDLMIISRYLEKFSDHPLRYAQSLGRSLLDRKLTEETLHHSFVRLQSLLQQLKQHNVRELSHDVFKINNELADELSRRALLQNPTVKRTNNWG